MKNERIQIQTSNMENGIANTIKISNKQCIKARLQSLQCARLSPCRNVRMTKNFIRGLGPRGPRVQSLVQNGEGRVHTLRFLAGNSTTFFSPFLLLRLLTVSVLGVACGGGKGRVDLKNCAYLWENPSYVPRYQS